MVGPLMFHQISLTVPENTLTSYDSINPYTRSRGMLPPDKVMDLLKQCNPPVGWGKLCPHALACKVGLSIWSDLCTFKTISLVLIHNFIAPIVYLFYQSTCGREIHICSSWWSTSYLPSSDWISYIMNILKESSKFLKNPVVSPLDRATCIFSMHPCAPITLKTKL